MRRCSGSGVLVPLFAIRLRTSSPPAPFPASSLALSLTRLAGSFTTPPRAVSSRLRTSRLTSRFPSTVSPPTAGPAPSGVSLVDPLPGPAPVQVAVVSGAAPSIASGGAVSGGAEPGGAGSEGVEPGGAESTGAEPGGAESEGAEFGGAETRAPGAGEPGDTEAGGAAVTIGAGDPTEPGAAGVGGAGAGVAGVGGTGAGGAGAAEAGAVDPGA
ncbi:unnamed protein product [Closterium sp. NIES-54]